MLPGAPVGYPVYQSESEHLIRPNESFHNVNCKCGHSLGQTYVHGSSLDPLENSTSFIMIR